MVIVKKVDKCEKDELSLVLWLGLRRKGSLRPFFFFSPLFSSFLFFSFLFFSFFFFLFSFFFFFFLFGIFLALFLTLNHRKRKLAERKEREVKKIPDISCPKPKKSPKDREDATPLLLPSLFSLLLSLVLRKKSKISFQSKKQSSHFFFFFSTRSGKFFKNEFPLESRYQQTINSSKKKEKKKKKKKKVSLYLIHSLS